MGTRRGAARIPVLAVLALASAGCDAACTWRARVDLLDAAGERPVPGAPLRTFWFDRYEENPLEMGVEQAMSAAAENRRSHKSWGITQTTWHESATDASGRATFGLSTFYAGALFLPLHDLLLGRRENDPAGFWIEVLSSAGGNDPLAEFIVLPTEEGYAPHLVRRSATGATVVGPAGTFGTFEDPEELGPGWWIRVRMPAPSAPER